MGHGAARLGGRGSRWRPKAAMGLTMFPRVRSDAAVAWHRFRFMAWGRGTRFAGAVGYAGLAWVPLQEEEESLSHGRW